MTSGFRKAIAWLIFGGVVFVTVSPIGWRPHTITTVNLDRALAFAVMSFAFIFAYPRSWRVVTVLIIVSALGIEALQFLSPTRHPGVHDAVFKALGAIAGVVFARFLQTRILATNRPGGQ